jgi:hypothetical protein
MMDTRHKSPLLPLLPADLDNFLRNVSSRACPDFQARASVSGDLQAAVCNISW